MIVVLAGFFFLCAIGAAVLFPVFSGARGAVQKTMTLSNAKQAALTMMMYAAENDDKLPPAFATNADLRAAGEPYSNSESDIFVSHNPAGGELLPNSFLASVRLTRVVDPHSAVLLYESMPWSDGRRIVGRVDGSAKVEQGFDTATMLAVELLPDDQ